MLGKPHRQIDNNPILHYFVGYEGGAGGKGIEPVYVGMLVTAAHQLTGRAGWTVICNA